MKVYMAYFHVGTSFLCTILFIIKFCRPETGTIIYMYYKSAQKIGEILLKKFRPVETEIICTRQWLSYN
jgi:hypothetical protein